MGMYALVFIGGGLGAVTRFALSTALSTHSPLERFPIGVLSCNIIGCFLIGLLVFLPTEQTPAWLPPLLVIGFLGGFTTFSSFGVEALKLFQVGALSLACAYILASVLGSLLAISLAYKLIR